MARKTTARYFILIAVVLAMALVAGCGGGGEDTGIASLGQGRWGHTALLLQDGRVLVVGGQATASTSLATAEVYVPSTSTWSPAGSMSEARGDGHTATLLEDGRVLLAGGSSSVEVYDPSTSTWSSTGSMSEVRFWHTATLLGDGRVLVSGGLSSTLSNDESATAEIFDPSTGEWTPTGSMEQVQSAHTATLLGDGRVLVMGKLTAEAYSPSTGTWSPAGEELRQRDRRHTATLLGDGSVLITGGESRTGAWGGFYKPVDVVDRYDPSTGTWSEASPMEEARASHRATLLEDGRVLVMGALATEIYDPATDTWTSAGEMKLSRVGGHTATLLGDGTVLVVGGQKDSGEGPRGFTAVEIYDPTNPTIGS